MDISYGEQVAIRELLDASKAYRDKLQAEAQAETDTLGVDVVSLIADRILRLNAQIEIVTNMLERQGGAT